MLPILIAASCGFSPVSGELTQGENSSTTTIYSFPDTCEEHADRTAETLVAIAQLLENEEQLSYLPGGRDEKYSTEGAQNFKTTYPDLSEHAFQMQNLSRTKSIICDRTDGGYNKDADMRVIELLGDKFENLTPAGQIFLSQRVAMTCDIAGMALMNRLTERPQYLTWEKLGFSSEASVVCERYAPMHPENNSPTEIL